MTEKQLQDRITKIELMLEEGEELSPTAFDNLLEELDICYELLKRFDPPVKRKSNEDLEWQREQAMEAGMLHGCDAYNEVMGY